MTRAFLLCLTLLAAPVAMAQLGVHDDADQCKRPVGDPSGRKAVIAGPTFDGNDVAVDLPAQEQIRNIGSKIDGAGMCVFSSIEMGARAQGLEEMRGWRDWCAANFSGGGWPERVDDYLKKWGKHKGIKIPDYLQYEDKDPEKLLEVIHKTRRMACITYGWGERYGQGISHMVCSPAYGKWGVILDNNFVAKKSGDKWDENIYEWLTREELVRRAKLGGGRAWVFVWLAPPPPPPSKNAKSK